MMIKTALTALASLAFVTALISAQAPQRAPDPRSMGGGDCRDNAYNCADAPNPLPASNTVWIEEMTWMDVRDSLKAGNTTAIIATGGMEPNGPWLVTGKHNYVLARRRPRRKHIDVGSVSESWLAEHRGRTSDS